MHLPGDTGLLWQVRCTRACPGHLEKWLVMSICLVTAGQYVYMWCCSTDAVPGRLAMKEQCVVGSGGGSSWWGTQPCRMRLGYL